MDIKVFVGFFLLLSILWGCGNNPKTDRKKETQLEYEFIPGDYELFVDLEMNSEIYFSGSKSYGYQAKLSVENNQISLIRLIDGASTILKTKQCAISFPCQVRILKNGNFFRFWIGDENEWIRGPLGEWEGLFEPEENALVAISEHGKELPLTIHKRKWLTLIENEIIKYGPEGSFYEQQIIPGAILEYKNKYYIYFMAGMKGDEEGSSRRTIGVAVSEDLKKWEVKPEPIVSFTDYPYDNLYVNGAVVTPDNKIALAFSAQQFPDWKGFMIAVSDLPDGRFSKFEKEPVYKHPTSAHEFDLIDLKESPILYKGTTYRYLMFYAGFTKPAINKKGGDRGFILYSNDLKDWISDDGNPVFAPETTDNWDAEHVRPRSLHRIGEYWYLWYEGCNVWKAPGHKSDLWCDVIGLARSKDLRSWEYHPRNPVLSGKGISASTCGCSWVGWPRMIVKDGTGYVFICGTQDEKVSVACRTIDISRLTDWNSDYSY